MNEIKPYTVEELQAIQREHMRSVVRHNLCEKDYADWPCPVTRLLATIAAKDEEIRSITEARNMANGFWHTAVESARGLQTELAQKTEDMSKDDAEFSYLREKVRGLRETANNWMIVALAAKGDVEEQQETIRGLEDERLRAGIANQKINDGFRETITRQAEEIAAKGKVIGGYIKTFSKAGLKIQELEETIRGLEEARAWQAAAILKQQETMQGLGETVAAQKSCYNDNLAELKQSRLAVNDLVIENANQEETITRQAAEIVNLRRESDNRDWRLAEAEGKIEGKNQTLLEMAEVFEKQALKFRNPNPDLSWRLLAEADESHARKCREAAGE